MTPVVVESFPDLMEWLFKWDDQQPGAFYVFLLLVLAAVLFGLFFGFMVGLTDPVHPLRLT